MHLDLELRQTVDKLSPDTSLYQFTYTLLCKQSNWFDRFLLQDSCLYQPQTVSILQAPAVYNKYNTSQPELFCLQAQYQSYNNSWNSRPSTNSR